MGEEYLPELKTSRVLAIYSQLVNGAILNKAELAQQFHVTQRSIQRDMESLRCFFADEGLDQDIDYDKSNRGYRLVNAQEKKLSNSEVLAVCKILLESRSMVADEMMPILDRLIDCCVPERNKAVVQSLVANERFHYVSPHHGKRILDGLWEIGMAVRNHQVMEIQYERMKEPRLVSRRIEPVGILFSEYYFYLAAFLRGVDRRREFENQDDLFPTIYRVETVVLLSKLNTKQHIEVELNLDELDLTAAESKATYDEIKAYVLEKYGLKVSSLYISQVKRKCGLNVGPNYNLSKKEDAKVPQCPPEKEAAIMEALKHFGMV